MYTQRNIATPNHVDFYRNRSSLYSIAFSIHSLFDIISFFFFAVQQGNITQYIRQHNNPKIYIVWTLSVHRHFFRLHSFSNMRASSVVLSWLVDHLFGLWSDFSSSYIFLFFLFFIFFMARWGWTGRRLGDMDALGVCLRNNRFPILWDSKWTIFGLIK